MSMLSLDRKIKFSICLQRNFDHAMPFNDGHDALSTAQEDLHGAAQIQNMYFGSRVADAINAIEIR